MPTLILRNLPHDLHTWLNREASAHDRSVNQEVIALLEATRTRSTGLQPKVTAEELLAIGCRCAALPRA
jgi:plasmid stability protein